MRIKSMKLIVWMVCLLCAAFAPASKRKIKVWMVGDSTMAIKQTSAYPETGWGMPFAFFFDSTVVIENRAMNGRSTKTFMAENRWRPVVENLHKGDYVFIQFGHNDEVKTKASYTTEAEFETNLNTYITDVQNNEAIPVLLTPVARRKFLNDGKVAGTHELYAAIVRRVAAARQVSLIDHDLLSQQVLQSMGASASKLLYNHLDSAQHPNYPFGKTDDTHFNELGARRMAELVLHAIRQLHLELAERVVKRQ